MNSSSPFFFMTCAAGIALLAGTVRAIKQNFIRQPADRSSFVGIAFFGVIEWLLWIATMIALLVTAPHPTTILLLVLLAVSIVSAIQLRYVEEVRSMNRWLKLSSNAPIPALVESLAEGCRSRLGIQAKKFVNRLNQGMSVSDAAHRSKFPLDADTIAAICVPIQVPADGPSTESFLFKNNSHENEPRENEHRELVRAERSSWHSASAHAGTGAHEMTRVFQQFAYVVATILLAWCFGKGVRMGIIPLFEEFDQTFSFSQNSNGLDGVLEGVALMGDVVAGVMVVWLLAALAMDRTPLFTVRWIPWIGNFLANLLTDRIPFLPARFVPWFGRRAIDRWRCEILDALHRGTAAGHPADQIFRFAKDATRSRWVRKRCQAALQSVDAGDSLPMAMRRSKLINATQEKWLVSAQSNGNLSHAIEQLSDNIQRWQTLRWKHRMAWLVPIATFLVGLFVLAHAASVFQFLSELVLISA